MNSDSILETKNITMVYPGGVVANRDINFKIFKGEIHALIGENGAGKSTLMNILYGLLKPTSGEILINGKSLQLNSSKDAIAAGIGMVHQHFKLVPSMTVTDNLILGIEPMKGGFINREKAKEEAIQISKKYQLEIDPEAKVRDISLAMMQKLEILKALYRGAEILILDEPTAVLTPQEIEELFQQLRLLREGGITIIFISHKLNEVKALCDRLTILRDGHTMGTHDVDSLSETQISTLLVGREVDLNIEKPEVTPGETVLSVKNISYTNHFGKKMVDDVSFSVKKSQIIGIAGIDGNGQSELVNIIVGDYKTETGSISLKGVDVTDKSIKYRAEMGMSHVSEDRMSMGTAPMLSLEENTISKIYDRDTIKNKGFFSKEKISNFTDNILKEFQVKFGNSKQAIKELSGGNIQKLVVGREYSYNPDFIILNQPTRGIDVKAIEFIRKKIIEGRSEEKAILLVSADLSEIMSLSDEILVMHDGKIVGHITDVNNTDEKELGLYMLGVKEDSKEVIEGAYVD
jgi:simple sugar transport system ATP-binding protein